MECNEAYLNALKCRKCGVYVTCSSPSSKRAHLKNCQRFGNGKTAGGESCYGGDAWEKVEPTERLFQAVLVLNKLTVSDMSDPQIRGTLSKPSSARHASKRKPQVPAATSTLTVRPSRKSSLIAMKKLRKVIEENLEGEADSNDCESEDESGILLDSTSEEEVEEQYRNLPRRKHNRKDIKTFTSDAYYKFKCDVCQTKFKTDVDFKWHMENIHSTERSTEIFTCPICGRMLNKRLSFQSHLKRHENAEATDEAFDLWNTWPKRKTSKNVKSSKVVVFNCKYCLIPHTSHYSFITHMKTEHPEKGRYSKFQCPFSCAMELESMKHLIMHLRNNHPEEYYGKTLKWEKGTNAKEGGSRPKGKCDICGRMLDVFYLRAHKERLHSSGKGNYVKNNDTHTYACPLPDCVGRFKNSALLKSHFILHLENNPYVCKVPGCGVKCDAQCHLDRHMRLHTGKPLVCSKCGVGYSRIDKLRNHICTFDRSKLRYDSEGLLLPVNSNRRLKRLYDESLSTPPQSARSILANDSHIIAKDDNVNLKKEENSSKLLTENLVQIRTKNTEDDFVNDGDKDYIPSDDSDSPPTESVDYDERDGSKNKKRKRHNINAIILSDAVFQKACEYNPGFRELIFGNRYLGRKLGSAVSARRISSKTYNCQDCLTSFGRISALQNHKLCCNGRADTSGVNPKHEIELNAGSEKGLEKIPIVSFIGCVICGGSFPNDDALNRHLKTDHTPDEIFRCRNCGDIFSSEKSRQRHFLSYHAHRPFQCSKCDKKFMTRNRLTLHKKWHCQNGRKVSETICSICGKELAGIQSVNRHKFLIHGIKVNPAEKPKKQVVQKKTNKAKKRRQCKRERKVRETEEPEEVNPKVKDYVLNIKTEPELHIEDDVKQEAESGLDVDIKYEIDDGDIGIFRMDEHQQSDVANLW